MKTGFIFAFGNKGQIIYISQSADMVMVRFGEQNIISLWRWIEAFRKISLEYSCR
ncbi:MAG: hypothetical protein K6C98_00580 [Treponema sp.]|nr:hypothetical protein [Treponema sp.]